MNASGKLGAGPAPQPLSPGMRKLLQDTMQQARHEGWQQGFDEAEANRFPALIVGLIVGAASAVPFVILAVHLLRH